MELSIKEYIARAKELEIAVYMQKQLMARHETIIVESCPKEPGVPMYDALPVDDAKIPVRERIAVPVGILMGIAIAAVLAAVFTGKLVYLCAFCALLCIAICVYLHVNNKRDYEYDVERYNWLKAEYEDRLQFVQEKNSKREEEYDHSMTVYRADLSEHTQNAERSRRLHGECLANLENALSEHYAMDVVYPKYRELVAITTIDEYLQSGRCSALEGAEGAYNLYEMELRQNIVIGKLATILDNMEQIKSNQYSLYNELSKVENDINIITYQLSRLKDAAKLNAYWAEMNARIAAAPKIITRI